MSHAAHANAALTPRARLRLARLIVDHGCPPARAAERYDMSWRQQGSGSLAGNGAWFRMRSAIVAMPASTVHAVSVRCWINRPTSTKPPVNRSVAMNINAQAT